MPERSVRRDDLISFCQFISYHGGGAELTVGGKSISEEQAEILVDAYRRIAPDNA